MYCICGAQSRWGGFVCLAVSQHIRRFMCSLGIHLVHLVRVYLLLRRQSVLSMDSVTQQCWCPAGSCTVVGSYIHIRGRYRKAMCAKIGCWRRHRSARLNRLAHTSHTHPHTLCCVVVWHGWHIDQCCLCSDFFFLFSGSRSCVRRSVACAVRIYKAISQKGLSYELWLCKRTTFTPELASVSRFHCQNATCRPNANGCWWKLPFLW